MIIDEIECLFALPSCIAMACKTAIILCQYLEKMLIHHHNKCTRNIHLNYTIPYMICTISLYILIIYNTYNHGCIYNHVICNHMILISYWYINMDAHLSPAFKSHRYVNCHRFSRQKTLWGRSLKAFWSPPQRRQHRRNLWRSRKGFCQDNTGIWPHFTNVKVKTNKLWKTWFHKKWRKIGLEMLRKKTYSCDGF